MVHSYVLRRDFAWSDFFICSYKSFPRHGLAWQVFYCSKDLINKLFKMLSIPYTCDITDKVLIAWISISMVSFIFLLIFLCLIKKMDHSWCPYSHNQPHWIIRWNSCHLTRKSRHFICMTNLWRRLAFHHCSSLNFSISGYSIWH